MVSLGPAAFRLMALAGREIATLTAKDLQPLADAAGVRAELPDDAVLGLRALLQEEGITKVGQLLHKPELGHLLVQWVSTITTPEQAAAWVVGSRGEEIPPSIKICPHCGGSFLNK